jgi:hypothetical protein
MAQLDWRPIILLAGGLFLIAKSMHEIHTKLETAGFEPTAKARGTLLATVLQIGLLDIVFSLDSFILVVAGPSPPLSRCSISNSVPSSETSKSLAHGIGERGIARRTRRIFGRVKLSLGTDWHVIPGSDGTSHPPSVAAGESWPSTRNFILPGVLSLP